MPIYNYRYEECKHTKEEIQTIEEGAVYVSKKHQCPECGLEGQTVVRLLGATSFQLKGGGWFHDGYS